MSFNCVETRPRHPLTNSPTQQQTIPAMRRRKQRKPETRRSSVTSFAFQASPNQVCTRLLLGRSGNPVCLLRLQRVRGNCGDDHRCGVSSRRRRGLGRWSWCRTLAGDHVAVEDGGIVHRGCLSAGRTCREGTRTPGASVNGRSAVDRASSDTGTSAVGRCGTAWSMAGSALSGATAARRTATSRCSTAGTTVPGSLGHTERTVGIVAATGRLAANREDQSRQSGEAVDDSVHRNPSLINVESVPSN